VQFEFWRDRLERAPLNARAWVFHERVLSSRILHFSHSQLFWECQEKGACEAFPYGMEGRIHDTISCKKLVSGRELVGYGSEADFMMQEYWDYVVIQYSKTCATFSKDRLIAVSGIALEFHRLVRSAYYASLWEYHLPICLLWSPGTGSRFKDYVAPSWSWASFNGNVSPGRIPRQKIRQCVNALSIQSTLINASNRFGQVASGSVRLSGKLFSVQSSSPYEWSHRLEQDVAKNWHKAVIEFRPAPGKESSDSNSQGPKFVLKVTAQLDAHLSALVGHRDLFLPFYFSAEERIVNG
jgi:hypothetical protein